MSYVIVGASAAGLAAAQAIRETDKKTPLTIISHENLVYSRIAITNYLMGDIPLDRMTLFKGDYWEKNNIKTAFNKKVVQILPKKHHIVLEDGEKIKYFKLLLCTGSKPIIPKIPGIDKKGVFSFWSLRDAQRISDYLTKNMKSRKAVVLGGGLIGLQAALALNKLKMSVVIVERLSTILPRILDDRSLEILMQKFDKMGLKILTGVEVKAILGRENVSAVDIGGKRIETDLVVVAVGVRPNISFMKETELALNQGLIVDETMRTSDPDIYAAGDVAEVVDVIDGQNKIMALWPTAVEGGRIAGSNIVNDKQSRHRFLLMNSMHIDDLYIATLGLSWVEDEKDFHFKQTFDAQRRFYRKLIFQGEKLVGAILVGDIHQAGFFRVLFYRDNDIDDFIQPIMQGHGYLDSQFNKLKTQFGTEQGSGH
jgi:NAD(P)H-nitrite reductase large subunit